MSAVPPGYHQVRLPLAGNPLRHINSYLVRGDDGYVLVDCGWDTPDVLEALEAALRDLGIGLDDVRALVVTHFHSDHYGLAGTLLRLGRLRLLMHRLDWLYVRSHLAELAELNRKMDAWVERNGLAANEWTTQERRALEAIQRYSVVAPHQELEDADTIRVGRDDLRVVWTPGHTPGHVCLYDASRRVLVSGDHVLDPITPNVSLWSAVQVNPLGEYLASLQKVAELDAKVVLPAHGEPFTGLRRRVRELFAHHQEREAAVLGALGGDWLTAAEVAQRLPWTRRRAAFDSLPMLQRRMALTETIAHLEELRAQGQVQKTEDADRVRYHA